MENELNKCGEGCGCGHDHDSHGCGDNCGCGEHEHEHFVVDLEDDNGNVISCPIVDAFEFEENDLPDSKAVRAARIKTAQEIWKKNGCKPELDEWLKSLGYIDANETVEDIEDATLGRMLNYLKKKYQDE